MNNLPQLLLNLQRGKRRKENALLRQPEDNLSINWTLQKAEMRTLRKQFKVLLQDLIPRPQYQLTAPLLLSLNRPKLALSIS